MVLSSGQNPEIKGRSLTEPEALVSRDAMLVSRIPVLAGKAWALKVTGGLPGLAGLVWGKVS